MSDNPHANGGLLLRDLKMPDFRDYAVEVPSPGATTAESTRVMGKFLRDVMKLNLDEQELPPVQPGREQLEPLAGRARGDQPLLHGRDLPGGRQAQPRRPRDGGAQRAPVPGLAGGLPADRPARLLLVLRGVHPHHRLDVQPARQVAEGVQPHPLAAADRLAQLPASARTSGGRTTTASATRTRASSTTSSTRRPRSIRVYLPPDANCLLSVTDHCLRSRNYVNVVVAGKQPAPQWLTMDQAIKHCTAGPRHLGVGQQRQGRRAGRGHGLLRRRADAGDAGGRRAAPQAPAGAEGARRSTS